MFILKGIQTLGRKIYTMFSLTGNNKNFKFKNPKDQINAILKAL
ncbi:hypothetical protein BDCR2A_01511 [Borrelia duttonii CR2A]|uniref:Uncharacterized protein n=1 Tax=Borrelia duttonii CR2A TaxID=1432657 RepID=W6TGQ8_9SPIR|nr:hypothetical protein BDCR2A_01511 [Borrelia duttonii CR2A]